MRLARRTLTPAGWRLRRVSLGLSCLLLALLDVGDCDTDDNSTSAVSVTSTATPSPAPQQQHRQQQEQDADAVTCYTCVNVSDNLICNRFAIDRPCPMGEPFCHTLHIMDSRGQSVVVHKKCAPATECTPRTVGCLDIDSQRVCVSCCDEMYCNEPVPTNHSTAVFSATRQQQLLLQHQRHSTASPVTSASSPAVTPLAVAIICLGVIVISRWTSSGSIQNNKCIVCVQCYN